MALGKYNRRTVMADTGAVISGATVTFYNQLTGLPVTAYDDPDGIDPIGSSVVSGDDGEVEVFLPPGKYRITTELGSYSDEITYEPIVGDLAVIDAGDVAMNFLSLPTPGSNSIPLILTSGYTDYRTLTQIKSDLGIGPDSAFATLSDLLAISSEQAAALNTKKVSTVVRNSGGLFGGANYEIKTLAQHRIDLDNALWVPDGDAGTGLGGDWYVGGTTYVAVLEADPLINAAHFGPMVHGTDCIATINKAMAYAVAVDRYRLTMPYVGTLIIDSVSLLTPRNIDIDLGGNLLRLAPSANKYGITQSDLATDTFVSGAGTGGFIEIHNFHFDGDASGQTRNLVGTDARDMYCGFACLFFGLDSLKIYDCKFIDTNAWAIAFFKCRDVEAYDIEFDQDETRIGLNGDGITGIATRIKIYDCKGYTNDDFCAAGTTRASIGGVQIWNDGIDIELFEVRNIKPIDKAGKSCHFIAGVYPSDGRTIKQFTMSDIAGNCENGLWRAGNYFSSVGAANGTVEKIQERNINGYSKTFSHGQRRVFSTTVLELNISGARNIVAANTANNQFLRVESANVNLLSVDGSTYQQVSTPGSREGVIFVDASSHVKSLMSSNFFHSLTTAQLATPERFTLIRNLGGRPTISLSNIGKGQVGNGNLNTTKDDYWVSANGILSGDLNITFSESIALVSADYTVNNSLLAHFSNGMVNFEGTLLSNSSSVPTTNQNGVMTRPDWAKPDIVDKTAQITFVKNGGGAAPQVANLVIRNGTQNLDFYNISGTINDCYINLTGVSFFADRALP